MPVAVQGVHVLHCWPLVEWHDVAKPHGASSLDTCRAACGSRVPEARRPGALTWLERSTSPTPAPSLRRASAVLSQAVGGIVLPPLAAHTESSIDISLKLPIATARPCKAGSVAQQPSVALLPPLPPPPAGQDP